MMSPIIKELPLKREDNLFNFREEILKVDILGEIDILEDLSLEISEKIPSLYVAGVGTTCLEITCWGVNKGTALLKLIKFMKVKAEDVVVIGNGDNDIPMFEIAGFSIAMGNSPQKVKNKANIIAPTNNDDGVPWAIDLITHEEQVG